MTEPSPESLVEAQERAKRSVDYLVKTDALSSGAFRQEIEKEFARVYQEAERRGAEREREKWAAWHEARADHYKALVKSDCVEVLERSHRLSAEKMRGQTDD